MYEPHVSDSLAPASVHGGVEEFTIFSVNVNSDPEVHDFIKVFRRWRLCFFLWAHLAPFFALRPDGREGQIFSPRTLTVVSVRGLRGVPESLGVSTVSTTTTTTTTTKIARGEEHEMNFAIGGQTTPPPELLLPSTSR